MYIKVYKLFGTMCDEPIVEFDFSIAPFVNDFCESPQTCKYPNTKKAQSLARRIAQTDVLVRKIQNAAAENQVLEQRLQEFQQSAKAIQDLYEEEKRQRQELCKKLQETEKRYAHVDEELAVKRLELEQLQAQFAESNGPIEYVHLVMRYLKLYNKMLVEGFLQRKEPVHVIQLRKYCEEQNITIPEWNDKSLPRAKKQKLSKPMQKKQQDACTQYISTVSTRGTNTVDLFCRQDVGIMCSLPLSTTIQIPTVDIMIRELLQYDISYMKPLSPIPDMSVLITKRTRNIGSCTNLCNIQRKIDFVPAKPVTEEHVSSSVTTDSFEPALFDKLWNGFGCMVFALLNKQRCKAETEQLKNAFSTWMPEVYEVLLSQTGAFPNHIQEYDCFENKNDIAKDDNSSFQQNPTNINENIYCNLNRQIPFNSALAKFLIAKSACDNVEINSTSTGIAKRGVKRSMYDAFETSDNGEDYNKKYLIEVPSKKPEKQKSCNELTEEYKLKIEDIEQTTRSMQSSCKSERTHEFATECFDTNVINNNDINMFNSKNSEETLQPISKLNAISSEYIANEFQSDTEFEDNETNNELVIDMDMEPLSEENIYDNVKSNSDEVDKTINEVAAIELEELHTECIIKETAIVASDLDTCLAINDNAFELSEEAEENNQEVENCLYIDELITNSIREIQSPERESNSEYNLCEDNILLCSPKQIPLDLDVNIIKQMHSNKTDRHLMFHLLRKYSNKAHMTINNTARKPKTSSLYKLVRNYMESQVNIDVIEAYCKNSISQLPKCLDIKVIVKAIVHSTKESLLFKEAAIQENQLIQQRILALASSMQINIKLFKSYLITEVDLLLFKLQNLNNFNLSEVISLTNLYLLAESILPPQKHSARLFIAKCLYYYKALAAPMIFAVLNAHPNALPHRDDVNYNRTDPLLSVIEHNLMSKKYDMDNHELRHRELLSKLRYEYHYQPFEPDRLAVLNNLIAKLRTADITEISFAFALFCKCIDQRIVLNEIVQKQLMPLAKEWREKKECCKRLATLLDCLSFIIKPFPLETDISDVLSLLQQLLNEDAQIIKEASVRAILRLQRFGHVNCFNALLPLRITDAHFDQTTQNMLQTFIHRKSLNFWRTACPEAFDTS